MPDVILNVADLRLRSRVNGPGVRSVVWVQGCTIGCLGCFNPHTHPHARRHLIDPVELGRFLAQSPGTEGVTISGGEPFQQAEGCAVLAETVLNSGKSVMVFTGYRYETLENSRVPAVKRFLATIDLIVAGPYVERLRGLGTSWRGSTNQTIHVLTDRLANEAREPAPDRPVVEAAIEGIGLSCTGFPDPEDRCWLERLTDHSYVRPSENHCRWNKTEAQTKGAMKK